MHNLPLHVRLIHAASGYYTAMNVAPLFLHIQEGTCYLVAFTVLMHEHDYVWYAHLQRSIACR